MFAALFSNCCAQTPPAVEATADGVFARVQIASLRKGRMVLPQNTSAIAIEIGTSDRDTLSTELLPLPRMQNLFLISCEPLVDKYSRLLARLQGSNQFDAFQQLGQHHARGIILPLAVSDGLGAEGAMLNLNVGSNSGCSSTLPLNMSSNRLKWCRKVSDRRAVPSLPLSTILGWVDPSLPIELIKVDAQGMDLRVIESAGGAALRRVRRFSLEVNSDDCDGMYASQPKCSQVVSRAASLGFAPATPIYCSPRVPRSRAVRTTAWGCELSVLFLAEGVDFPEHMHQFHGPNMNGCAGVFDAASSKVDNDTLVLRKPGMWVRAGRPHEKIRGMKDAGATPFLCDARLARAH